MASNEPVKVDKKEIEHAQKLWENFGVATKWSVILVVAAIILLALITL